MARTKLTAERAERIIQAVRAGNFLEPSAAHAGIHKATLHRWLGRGEHADEESVDLDDMDRAELDHLADSHGIVAAEVLADDDLRGRLDAAINDHDRIYRDFYREVTRARADAEVRAVTLIQQAAREDARHAQWYLERSFPDRWGRQRIELTGDDGGPIRMAGDAALAAALAGAPSDDVDVADGR